MKLKMILSAALIAGVISAHAVSAGGSTNRCRHAGCDDDIVR